MKILNTFLNSKRKQIAITAAVISIMGIAFATLTPSSGVLSKFTSSTPVTSQNASITWTGGTDNAYRSRLVVNHVIQLDELVLLILRKGSSMSNIQFKSYLTNLSNGITALGSKTQYIGNVEVQNILGFLVYEINTTIAALNTTINTATTTATTTTGVNTILIGGEKTTVSGTIQVAGASKTIPFNCEAFVEQSISGGIYIRCESELKDVPTSTGNIGNSLGSSITLPGTLQVWGKTLTMSWLYYGTNNQDQIAYSDATCSTVKDYSMGSGFYEKRTNVAVVIPNKKDANSLGQTVANTNCNYFGEIGGYGKIWYKNKTVGWTTAELTYENITR